MIRVAWGAGAAEMPMASFDAALAEAGAHQYNIRELSSVIPAGVAVETPGRLPVLGAPGTAVDAVLARRTSPPGEPAVAGLAWARGAEEDEPLGVGTFYETGGTNRDRVRERLRTGIARGAALRDIDPVEPEFRVVETGPTEHHVSAVALAAYGDAKPLV